MPFGIGVGEVFLLLMILGVVAGGVYLGARTISRLSGGERPREFESAKRDLEREIERMNRRKRLPGE